MALINPFTGKAFSQEVEVLGYEQIKQFLYFEDLLKKMQIGLVCMPCTRMYGPPMDGVMGKIMPGSREFHLECNHRDRVFKVKSREDEKIQTYL